MSGLIRSDFYRVFKSKLGIVSVILTVLFPLLTAALFRLIREIGYSIAEDAGPMIDLALNAFTLIASSFSFTNNIGLILPVFAAILVMTDISSGTVRNKIIQGHSRYSIYASHFIVSMTYCVGLIAVYVALTAGFGVAFLGNQMLDGVSVESLVYFYVLGGLCFAFVASVATCMSLLTLNNAGAILLTLLVCMGFGLFSSLLVALVDDETALHVLRFIPSYVVTEFQMGGITPVMFLEGLGGTLLFSGAFYALGTFSFAHRDLK